MERSNVSSRWSVLPTISASACALTERALAGRGRRGSSRAAKVQGQEDPQGSRLPSSSHPSQPASQGYRSRAEGLDDPSLRLQLEGAPDRFSPLATLADRPPPLQNNKGYTIPLDKRLAADGRGLQDIQINDRFAQFSEALYVADRHAREEVRQRSLMQQKIAQKEKEAKEENLRMLAQRAREERSGIASGSGPSRVTAGEVGGAAMPSALAGYGSDSDSEAASEDEGERSEEDEEAARQRDIIRKESNTENKRKMGMANMGTERRAKEMAK
jgi:hypothetical protein